MDPATDAQQPDDPPRRDGDGLATPIQFVKGVGPQRGEIFARLGVRNAGDLLFLFPRDYQDLTSISTTATLEEDTLVSVTGVVEDVDSRELRGGRSMVGVMIRDDHGYLRGIWFNQPHMFRRFAAGQRVLFSGKPRLQSNRWEMTHPRVEWIEDEEAEVAGRLLPVYPLTEGLRQYDVRRAVAQAIEIAAAEVPEAFPPEVLAEQKLLGVHEALQQIHSPASYEQIEQARHRFIFQELFVLQLAVAVKRAQLHAQQQAPPLETTAKIDARIRRRFPFTLTNDQQTAIAEINADMAHSHPMNRLLQGDVGSGKTVVALYAMLVAVAHGHQAVLMAPTEVLARQHALTLTQALSESQVRVALLVGSLSSGERQKQLARVAEGEADIIVGTQAVLQESVHFARLGLVVIDEQHKFGVRQRARLKQSSLDPHYLVMTATPIPRTVAMTVFGDLDVSTIRESPPGRPGVNTYLITDEQRPSWWEFVGRKLNEGRQAYIVAPLVEESEQNEVASIEALYESLANGPLEAYRLALLHGRMSTADKEAVMTDFRNGRAQVLVATTVVEVGVDVPNATLMTIEGAERFGLAQLHQLRGRVNRGTSPGFCAVFANPTTDDAQKRLSAFVENTDGFKLAEIDFELRGPGEILGTRQHGLPPFRIADLIRDADTLSTARAAAIQLVATDPGLAQPEHARLRQLVLNRYGEALDLVDVG